MDKDNICGWKWKHHSLDTFDLIAERRCVADADGGDRSRVRFFQITGISEVTVDCGRWWKANFSRGTGCRPKSVASRFGCTRLGIPRMQSTTCCTDTQGLNLARIRLRMTRIGLFSFNTSPFAVVFRASAALKSPPTKKSRHSNHSLKNYMQLKLSVLERVINQSTNCQRIKFVRLIRGNCNS